ncbi:MAG: DUF4160 domain-containing protein [Chitinispirillia bacterium]|nr:DUF4160 domain-containing protein [Chitinispirillia bacterium]MCL2241781.1 DUF4160 domain-containing protein [Chitinispirillia bacterium]
MPEISRFLGMIIRMYYDEHCPPHFHVIYNEYEAQIEIETLGTLKGELPTRVLGLVLEWAELYRDDLLKNWILMKTTKNFNKIPPLV